MNATKLTAAVLALVEDYIAALDDTEFNDLIARTRDPEGAQANADDETDTGKIAARMFGGN